MSIDEFLIIMNHTSILTTVALSLWIGRHGAVEWSARSPLDFFLWGYLKDKVYRTKPRDLAHLRNLIVQEAQDIPRDYLQNAVDGFYNRLGHCQTMGGEHFEHLL
ncbi:hypothetical protein J6590_074652 [Homalodisca vitripennis]|nr:hypothetical protein J6590_074652 [Homalodisca vitripennis]